MKAIWLGAVVSFVFALVFTPLLGRWTRPKLSTASSIQARNTHLVVPAPSGDLAIVAATVGGYLVTRLCTELKSGEGPTVSAVLLLGLFIGLGLIGWLVDSANLARPTGRSLLSLGRIKLAGQVGIVIAFVCLGLGYRNAAGTTPLSLHISYARDLVHVSIGGTLGLIVLAGVLILGSAHSVGHAEGFGAFTAGACAMIFGTYTIINFIQTRLWCAVPNPVATCFPVRDPLDTAILAASTASSCIGFLWWRASTRRLVSLGNAGSLALGGLMAGIAMTSRTELLLFVTAGVFGAMAIPTLLQAGLLTFSRRTASPPKRIFKMVPLPYHLQLGGWHESATVVRVLDRRGCWCDLWLGPILYWVGTQASIG